MSSCSGSFLDEDRNPNSLSPSVFWKNETDIMKGLTSAYAALQPNIDWAIPFERYIVIDNFRSDECDFRADVSSWMSIAMFTNESTSSVSKTEWTNLYTGVNFANQCIDNIPNVPGSAEIDGLKKQAIAEARFLRAFYYYRLYINFGEIIPIYLHQIEGTERNSILIRQNLESLSNSSKTSSKKSRAIFPRNIAKTRADAQHVTQQPLFSENSTCSAENCPRLRKSSKTYRQIRTHGELCRQLRRSPQEQQRICFEVQFSGNQEGGHYEYNLSHSTSHHSEHTMEDMRRPILQIGSSK